MNLIIKAAQFAHKAHIAQLRKFSGDPYFVHLARVAGRVAALENTTEEMVAAAYLHDACEDTDAPQVHATEWNEFPCKVQDLVVELTNVYTKLNFSHLNRKTRKKLETERIGKISQAAKCIKLIDRIDNIEDFKRTGNLEQYYINESRALLEVLRGANPDLEKELQNLVGINGN